MCKSSYMCFPYFACIRDVVLSEFYNGKEWKLFYNAKKNKNEEKQDVMRLSRQG